MEEKPEPPWEVMLAEAELGSRPRARKMAGSVVGDIMGSDTGMVAFWMSGFGSIREGNPFVVPLNGRGRWISESGSGEEGLWLA